MIIIIAWIVVSFVFSMGARVPYSRPLNAVLDFLRDVTEPYLRIFRRLPLRDRPARPLPDRRDPRAADRRRDHRGLIDPVVTPAGPRRAWWPPPRSRADQAAKALVRSTIDRADASTSSSASTWSTSATAGSRSGCSPAAAPCWCSSRWRRWRRCWCSSPRHRDRPLVWLPTGLLIGGAAGNLIDRAREGAVTDFIDCPLWPAFNVADMAITFGVLTLLYVLEGPPRHGAEPRAGGRAGGGRRAARRLPGRHAGSRAAAQRLIDAGLVLVDGPRSRSGTRVAAGSA